MVSLVMREPDLVAILTDILCQRPLARAIRWRSAAGYEAHSAQGACRPCVIAARRAPENAKRACDEGGRRVRFDERYRINERAVAKVEHHRVDALERGAYCVAGGASPGGRLSMPTLIADVSHDALLTRDDTIGPLAAVIAFKGFDEGLRLANDTPYGLAAYLCSSDPATIERASRALEAGTVGINTGAVTTPLAPVGGIKMSGYGREGSAHGLAEYQSLKYVCQAGL